MKINEATQIALEILVFLAEKGKGKIFTCSQIAKAIERSCSFTEHVYSKLRKAHLVKTKKGPGGGISLHLNPGEINLLTVIEAMGGKLEYRDTARSKMYQKGIHTVLNKVTYDMRAELKDCSIYFLIH